MILENFCGAEMEMGMAEAWEPRAIPIACRESYRAYSDEKNFPPEGISMSRWKIQLQNAWLHWRQYIDVHCFWVLDRASSNLIVNWGPHQNNVMATAQLGDGTCNQKTQQWANNRHWADEHLVFLVAIHEFGHNLGLRHLQTSEPAVMRAGIDQTLPGLRKADIEAAQERGYRVKQWPDERPRVPTTAELASQVSGIRSDLQRLGKALVEIGQDLRGQESS